MDKAFSFLESLLGVPYQIFKDTTDVVFGGKQPKENTVNFLGRTLGEAIQSTSDKNVEESAKLLDSAATLIKSTPSTTAQMAQGQPLTFNDPRLSTAMRNLINKTNNRELLEIISRANYTPKAVRPSNPTIRVTPTKFG